MTRIVCTSPDLLPENLEPGTEYITVYRSSGRQNVGTVGTGILRDLERAGFNPSVQAWDFTTFALAVSASDQAALRSRSSDGWTRIVDLTISLVEPAPFEAIRTRLEAMLRYLTGDFWHLSFSDGGEPAATSAALVQYDADCVSLLSGGIDSLVGAIDLTAAGLRPLFVSQMAKGDSETQVRYARHLDAGGRHLQWNQNIRLPHATERSTRARSIVFFAFAVLAADELLHQRRTRVDLVVPENGFISLNIPLNAGRMGSLSTKTTHPVFLDRLQEVLTALQLPLNLLRPYAFKTKGELMSDCADQVALRELVGESTSCGRFGYYNYTHCGRCVPCLVRRASFLSADIPDTTHHYHFHDLRFAGRAKGANDIGAVAAAALRLAREGVRSLTAGQLSFATSDEREGYEGVVVRGLHELEALLQREGVL